MSICGYNDKIGEGLRLLVEGMVDALKKKAKRAPLMEVLVQEGVELDAMIAKLSSATGETLPQMFVGLNVLAKALFERVQNDLSCSNGEDLDTACREVGESFIRLLADTEAENEALRASGNTLSADKFARELAAWALRRAKQIDRRHEKEKVELEV